MGAFIQDIRYAVRRLAKTPLFSLGALAIMAIAIGATTAVFAAVNEVLLSKPPFEDPERVMAVYQDSSGNCHDIDLEVEDKTACKVCHTRDDYSVDQLTLRLSEDLPVDHAHSKHQAAGVECMSCHVVPGEIQTRAMEVFLLPVA